MLTTVLALLLVGATPLVDAVKSGDKAAVIALIERRASLGISVSGGELLVALGESTFTLVMTEHRIT